MKSAPSVCTDGEDLQEACRKETARLEKEKKQKEEQELSNLRMFIGSFVKSNLKTDAAKKVMALCKEEGFDNPLTISSLSSANKIKAYIESL